MALDTGAAGVGEAVVARGRDGVGVGRATVLRTVTRGLGAGANVAGGRAVADGLATVSAAVVAARACTTANAPPPAQVTRATEAATTLGWR